MRTPCWKVLFLISVSVRDGGREEFCEGMSRMSLLLVFLYAHGMRLFAALMKPDVVFMIPAAAL